MFYTNTNVKITLELLKTFYALCIIRMATYEIDFYTKQKKV